MPHRPPSDARAKQARAISSDGFNSCSLGKSKPVWQPEGLKDFSNQHELPQPIFPLFFGK